VVGNFVGVIGVLRRLVSVLILVAGPCGFFLLNVAVLYIYFHDHEHSVGKETGGSICGLAF
jgi:hypothetical protein